MKTLENLAEGDYIAFGYNHNGGEPNEIFVANISFKREKYVTVHFMYGHHSIGETVNYEDIIAIGDMSASGKIKHWGGKFNILQPEHRLLKALEND